MIRNEKGVTLLEILAATAILGFLVIGFLNLAHFNAKAKLEQERRAEALRLAEEQLNLKRAYYHSVPAVSAVSGNQVVSDTTSGFYRVLIQLSDLTSSPVYAAPAHPKQVFVQSVVLVKDASNLMAMLPRLLTVTVSWGG
ncbi:type IV pilus modification PilV family protein [Paenibacillus sp. GYB003]|uniref:type IV pilus modification PilV family protein n=1 Tax=Paenibacillus sp. GYB003 TaxID=2994392 RepID=UPI002F964A67